MLGVIYVKCRKIGLYAECRYAECRGAQRQSYKKNYLYFTNKITFLFATELNNVIQLYFVSIPGLLNKLECLNKY